MWLQHIDSKSVGALVLAGAALSAPTRRAELDHVGAYNFKVEIEGVTQGSFKAVDGLSSEIEVIEYQDGDDLVLRKRPGRVKFGDITLKKGYIANNELKAWWKSLREGRISRKGISIQLNDDTNRPIKRWDGFEAWPKQWKVNGFDGKGNDVVTEEIVFVVESLQAE